LAGGDRLRLDRGRAGRLARGRLHAGHISLADLLGDEIAAGPQMRRDRAQVEWRMPVDDHVERFWYRLKPWAGGMIPLTVPEIKRLLADILTRRPAR
jgi:hypothetical protein